MSSPEKDYAARFKQNPRDVLTKHREFLAKSVEGLKEEVARNEKESKAVEQELADAEMALVMFDAALGQEPAPQAEMPQYQCHKKVRALRINYIRQKFEDGFGMSWILHTGFEPIIVGADYIFKHAPEEGGYYVVYEDGYVSYSPAAAFESGYTLIA
jgi:hypothetical protein